MELEPLFEGRFAFKGVEGDHFAAYGEDGDKVGYVVGDGAIKGQQLRGTLTWTNTPRKRADGTWLYDFTGLIRTDDDVLIRFETGGYNWSLTDDPFEYVRRKVVGALTFQTAGEKYRWLNTTYALLEADVGTDDQTQAETWLVKAFAVRPDTDAAKE